MNTIRSPYIPKMDAPNINKILYHLNAFTSSVSVNINDDIAVIATTIIMIGDTIPADTAASPNINAPTIDRAEFAKLGNFKSLSFNNSNAAIIRAHSIKVGKGTDSLWAAMLVNSSVGIISWLYVVSARYVAGVNSVIKNAIYLNILVNSAFLLLL